MSKPRRRRPKPAEEPAPPCAVSICRGGECGSHTKHPEVDHRAQLARIKGQLEGHAIVSVTKCLDACEHSNVIVVSPTGQRQGDAEPVWLGEMNDETSTADLISWVQAGGPGLAEIPLSIEITSFKASRRMRHALDE